MRFPGGSAVKDPPAVQELQESRVRSLGREAPLEKGMATRSCCLENPMDRGAWQATVHGVAKSWAPLKQLSPQHTYSHILTAYTLWGPI